jgi:hypothetical protein
MALLSLKKQKNGILPVAKAIISQEMGQQFALS